MKLSFRYFDFRTIYFVVSPYLCGRLFVYLLKPENLTNMEDETMNVVPYVVEQTNRGERSYDIYSRLLKDRIVFVGATIDDAIANSIIAQLLFLAAEDPEKDIHMYINSPGGSVSAGFGIYDTMQIIKPQVNTICTGFAASYGAILPLAGAKGKRLAPPNSEIMIHQPLGGVQGRLPILPLRQNAS